MPNAMMTAFIHRPKVTTKDKKNNTLLNLPKGWDAKLYPLHVSDDHSNCVWSMKVININIRNSIARKTSTPIMEMMITLFVMRVLYQIGFHIMRNMSIHISVNRSKDVLIH